MPRTRTPTGFALMLVLILVAAGVILSVSYLSAASLHVGASRNFQLLSRARYLAESGLEHAICMLRDDPRQFDGSDANPLGPYYVDDSSDSYVVSAEQIAGRAGQYVLTATGRAGETRWTARATVQYSPGRGSTIKTGLMVGYGLADLPGNLTVNGDLHVNSALLNRARINGDVSATHTVYDPLGRINGSVTEGAEPVEPPDISPDQYFEYTLSGRSYEAETFPRPEITPNSPIARGRAVTPDNVGGVVRLQPPRPGNYVRIRQGVEFTGTLLIEGHLVLDGRNIKLESVDGFPAIVATGGVYISRQARDILIDGTVVTGEGLLPWRGRDQGSSTTINGAVVSRTKGYGASLSGRHTLNYDTQKATLYGFASGGEEVGAAGQATVSVLAWHN
jgi:cytoskeletal protein CcmA (bactofilin family)